MERLRWSFGTVVSVCASVQKSGIHGGNCRSDGMPQRLARHNSEQDRNALASLPKYSLEESKQ
jgi:hypothetical protein